MMPVRLLKPAEANDGSYAGLVLAAFDRLAHPERDQLALPLARPDELFGDDNVIAFAPIGTGATTGAPR
ncbi:MAG: hypothetical protein ACTHM0_13530 [Sphingomonas sp.]